jgi:hypothetical protein
MFGRIAMRGKLISVFVGFLAITGTALADEGCVGGEESAWKSPDEAKQAAIALNYSQISKVIIEDGCYEVVTINADGMIVGVQLDPVTLAVYKIEEPR